MLKYLITIIISCLLAFNLSAQEVVVEYPYNPDFENDGNVGVEDLMQLLASFGMGFDVDELTIDEVVLSEWLQAISETLVAQQALIDSLMSNEANSGIGQLDSALIADMINDSGSAMVSFGERVHLAEPADWGPLPWDEYVNYGTYDFDDAGIFMGFFKYPFYDIYLLHDTIDVQELSASQLQDHYSVAQTSNGTESFSVPVGVDERIVVRGLPNSFGASDDYNFDWVPLSTSSLDAASEGESFGLAFGEKEFWDLDGFEWLPIDFPQMDVTFIEAQTDGILHVDGTTAYPPYGLAVVPSDLLPCDDFGDCDGMTIALIFMGDDFENYQYNSFSYADAAPVTIAVKEGEVICLRKNPNTASWQRFIWVPLVSSSSGGDDSSTEQSLGPCQGEQTVTYNGHDYDLVEIADQCWFAENLRTASFRNGDPIDLGLPAVLNPTSAYMPAGNPICGCVYNKAIVYDGRDVCPSGFHLPTALDFSELLGATIGWSLVNTSPTGFNALMGSGTDPLYIDGNNCGSYNPFYNQWGNYEAQFLTSTFAAASSTADDFPNGDPDEYYDFVIFETGPGDVLFSDLDNYYGQYIRCVRD